MRYLITGAASGIGRAVARSAARSGREDVAVALVDRDAAALDAVAEELDRGGVRTTRHVADLADPE